MRLPEKYWYVKEHNILIQLDENALFYMQQRGISLKEARLLLMFAFVNEVIDTIRLDALKDRLHLLVEKRFRGELNKCQGCAICK